MNTTKRPQHPATPLKSASTPPPTPQHSGSLLHDLFGEVVLHEYSRAQAIADGVLIDVTELAREAGFRYPVALTAAAYHDSVRVSATDPSQDETGRLWDVLNVLRFTARAAGDTCAVQFTVDVWDAQEQVRTVSLKSLCGPGDSLEPVITIMLPEED